MSRRSPIFRALGGFLAFWFALATGELQATHVCPMHDGVSAGAMDMSGSMSHAAHHEAPAPTHSHTCTCIGACSASGFATLPSVAPVPVGTLAAAHRVSIPDAARRWAIAPAHSLPFATAPPSEIHVA